MSKNSSFKKTWSFNPESYNKPSFLWILLVGSVLLAAATAFYTYNGVSRERQQLLRSMEDRASVLMWALEGSSRSMQHRQFELPLRAGLVQEVANQPGISYICLVDKNNKMLIHSETEESESQYSKSMDEERILDPEKTISRLISKDDAKVYEVSKRFTPSLMQSHMRRMGMPARMDPIKEMNREYMEHGHGSYESLDSEALYLVVGIDARNFDQALATYTKHSLLMSLLVLMAGFSIFALSYFVQNYRYSRRLLQDTQALASQIVRNLPIALIAAESNGKISLINSFCISLFHLDKKDINLNKARVFEEEKAAEYEHDFNDKRSLAQKTGKILRPLIKKSKSSSADKLQNKYKNNKKSTQIILPENIRDMPFLDWESIVSRLKDGIEIIENEMEVPIDNTSSIAISLSAAKISGTSDESPAFLFIIRDLGEVRKLQKQIRLNERLSALGNMAAGVAHEIRNPLSSVKGYALFLSEKLKSDEKAYDTALLMIKEIERLNRVVTDLLVLARPGELRLESIEPEAVINRCLRLIELDASAKGIKLSKSIDENCGLILADQDKLVQSLLNILLNSIQAIQESGGSIHVSAGLSEKRLSGGSSFLLGADSIVIRIRDTGVGMSEKVQSNLFTPYFSTKASGSGLGLSITHQIIEQHHGEITAASQEGKGAVFTIRLPKAV